MLHQGLLPQASIYNALFSACRDRANSTESLEENRGNAAPRTPAQSDHLQRFVQCMHESRVAADSFAANQGNAAPMALAQSDHLLRFDQRARSESAAESLEAIRSNAAPRPLAQTDRP